MDEGNAGREGVEQVTKQERDFIASTKKFLSDNKKMLGIYGPYSGGWSKDQQADLVTQGVGMAYSRLCQIYLDAKMARPTKGSE